MAHKFGAFRERSKRMGKLDDAHHCAKTQFEAADLGDARRTSRLMSTMAAIARASDESLPRQLGLIGNTKAAYRLFDCGAVTREAVMVTLPRQTGPRATCVMRPLARAFPHGPAQASCSRPRSAAC